MKSNIQEDRKISDVRKQNPWIKKAYLELQPPRLGDNKGHVDRLVQGLRSGLALETIHVPYRLWNRISETLRSTNYRVTSVLSANDSGYELIDIDPGDTTDNLYGVAVDLGTTSIVVYLVDLSSGKRLGEITTDNPQIEYGTDILTRINYATRGKGLPLLKNIVIESLNRNIRALSERHGIGVHSIYGMVVAGNTTMTHLFLGVDPSTIHREPYIPLINNPGFVKASELSLSINNEGCVFVFPNVGSYVGGDIVAGILFSRMHEQSGVSLFVDIGTNAEVVLGNKDWLIACAGAAGPALEGGVAQMGARAGNGIIDHIRINDQSLRAEYSVIGENEPVGMCGSAIIDLTAEMFEHGIIDLQGKIRTDSGAPLTKTENGPAYVVVPASRSGLGKDIVLSQVDLSVLLRSKAAMYTILKTITQEVGITFSEIENFYVAGTFGSYIDPRKAIILGMIPDMPLDKYVSLGNSSGEGACWLLADRLAFKDVKEICAKLTYLELNVNQWFMNQFSAAKFIPHTDQTLFPSVFKEKKRL